MIWVWRIIRMYQYAHALANLATRKPPLKPPKFDGTGSLES